jgi:hypothetical protein
LVFLKQCFLLRPWRRGKVVIASASRPEDRGFESRRGVRFLGIYMYVHCNAVVICSVHLDKINVKRYF